MPAVVNTQRCTGCGECVEVCPCEAVELIDAVAEVLEENCTECVACVDECSEEAIELVL